MSRRTFITIAIGVLFALFMALLWWWFFGAGGAPAPKPAGSTFGSSSDRTSGSQTNTSGSGSGTGYPSGSGQTGQNAGQGGLGSGGIGSGSGGSGQSGSGTLIPTLAGSGGLSATNGSSGSNGSSYPLTNGSPNGVNWLAGGGIGSGGPTSGTPGGSSLGSTGYGYNGNGLSSGAPGSGGINVGSYNPYGPGVVGPGGPGFGTSTGPLALNSGSGTPFTPAQINDLNLNNVNGTVYVPGTAGPDSNGGGNGNGLAIGLIAGTGVACSAFLAQGALSGLIPSLQVPTADSPNNTKSFMDCLMRTIARAALQQITNSIVQWINSGFNGSPSFVTNYQQFFQSVADQAAGSFIQNYTNFAPLCTPFRNQIRIALAHSYARRNTAPSCSLSTLLGTNTQSLFSGKMNGWSNLLQFTTVPANNPYGAYMSVQTGLQNTVAGANQNAQRNISSEGFLNLQQVYQCNPGSAGSVGQTGGTCPVGCKCRVTTPGSTISATLNKTLGVSQDYLTQAGISGSFDAIINALINQLAVKALSGLGNAVQPDSSFGAQTFDQQTAQAQGQYLMTQLQGLVTLAQQYGQSEQGSIQDIQSAQTQLNTLANCWQAAASSTNDASKQQQAAQEASSTLATLHGYDTQVATLNANITKANAAIAALQDMQTRVLGVTSTNDVSAVQQTFDTAQAAGQLIAPSDLTQAQQDRTSLQSTLNTTNQATSASLAQCNAFDQTSN